MLITRTSLLTYSNIPLAHYVLPFAVSLCGAQGCLRITADDLGNVSNISSTGLIARTVGRAVWLQRFNIVCEATAGYRDRYTSVSVVANYTEEFTSTQAQFEFSCVPGNVWDTADQGFTTPPDVNNILLAIKRRDCSACISPDAYGNSLPGNNHCLRKYVYQYTMHAINQANT